MSYIPFPDISPEIFSIPIGGMTFALRWYAVAYIAGLLLGWQLIVRMIRTPRLWAKSPHGRRRGREPAHLGNRRRDLGRAAWLYCLLSA